MDIPESYRGLKKKVTVPEFIVPPKGSRGSRWLRAFVSPKKTNPPNSNVGGPFPLDIFRK